MIQNQISEQVDGKIPSKHIQLYHEQRDKGWGGFQVEKNKVFMFGDDKIGGMGTSMTIKWSIVPYDTMNGDQLNMHKVSIYDEKSSNNSNIGWLFDDDAKEKDQKKRSMIDVYVKRVTAIYDEMNQMDKLPKVLRQMNEHKQDGEWLHALYSKICSKYNQVEEEPYTIKTQDIDNDIHESTVSQSQLFRNDAYKKEDDPFQNRPFLFTLSIDSNTKIAEIDMRFPTKWKEETIKHSESRPVIPNCDALTDEVQKAFNDMQKTHCYCYCRF